MLEACTRLGPYEIVTPLGAGAVAALEYNGTSAARNLLRTLAGGASEG
jgi:hypothetical protein